MKARLVSEEIKWEKVGLLNSHSLLADSMQRDGMPVLMQAWRDYQKENIY
jgi:hypothetical protein